MNRLKSVTDAKSLARYVKSCLSGGQFYNIFKNGIQKCAHLLRKLGTGNSFIKLLTPEEEIAELLTEKYHKITQKCHKKDVNYF